MGVEGRTVRQLVTDQDIWRTVDEWAAMSGFELKAQEGPRRLYQRGSGALIHPQMVQVTAQPGGYSIEAWVRVPPISRAFTLWLMPEEMIIDNVGMVGVLPRNKAREEVNKLLAALGIPLIT